MLTLRIAQLMKERNIRFPLAALRKAGISQEVAKGYLDGTYPKLIARHAEKLCLFFKCTVDDLYEWEPDDPADDYPENPLQAIRKKPALDLGDKLKNLPLSEIRKKLG